MRMYTVASDDFEDNDETKVLGPVTFSHLIDEVDFDMTCEEMDAVIELEVGQKLEIRTEDNIVITRVE